MGLGNMHGPVWVGFDDVVEPRLVYWYCSFEEGGKLLCQMIQHVGKTIDICEEVKYNNDEKLEKLKTLLKELKEDYLVQHLHRYTARLSAKMFN